jgi:hypothetical protein
MYYSAAGERGTIEAHGLERQRKFDGLCKWKFKMLMQMFPLLLQLGLLLFAAALSVYLWTVHFSLAIIILCFTTFGFTSYVLLLISSLVSPDSPFQTPLSLLVALVIPRTFWMGFGSFLIWVTAQTWAFVQLQIDQTHDFLPYFSKLIDPLPPAILDPEDPESSTEIPAVLWILEASTDPRTVTIAAEMVVDLQWPSSMDVDQQLSRLGTSFLGCLDYTLTTLSDGPSYTFTQMNLRSVRDGLSTHAIHIGCAYRSLHYIVN